MSAKTKVCSHCGSSDIDVDTARGDAVCTNCGSVLEDNIIVSEVTFQENSIGGTSVLGQFVSSEGVKSSTMGGSFHHGFGKESRAITLQNGRKKINQLGSQLQLNQHCLETAYNFYKMAVGKRLTRGRKITHVISACLYLVCRTESTAHMLLDFSDILQVNVYELGKTYLKLAQELCINVPAVDPCILIPRFSHKLEFGDKTHDVSMTALRLVQRMKRDWMHVGRRPSGLCGAALLVAARLHDFNRTQKDVLRVVKVCDGTLRKRLIEFERTPSSKLKLDQFMDIDLEEEQDPPSFTEARWKDKISKLEEMCKLTEVEGEISTLQEELDQALEKKPRRNDSSSTLDTQDDDAPEDELNEALGSEEASKEATEFVQQETLRQIHEDLDLGNYMLETADETCASAQQPPTSHIPTSLQLGFAAEDGPGPTAASLGIKESIVACMRVEPGEVAEEEDGELDLTGIDDDELDKFILTEDEVKVKTDIWTKVNAEYLQQQKEKEEREAREKAEGITKPEPKKRKKPRKKQQMQASTAGEAIEKMLQEKKISSKINYEVLRDLNRAPDVKKTEAASVAAVLSGSLDVTPVRIKREASSVQQRSAQKMKTEETIVVESGPVQYEPDEEQYHGEDYDEEDEMEEHISAAQLLGHGVADELYDEYDEA
ncbi:PREDICTED: transcription factor IIIB 90 kDa subunit-like [Priapulus caudatus]|uniref:B-related factor 1 n=1 Tax=Priapulus caudatus TaxID=37621 RepID=A0ABM1EMR9_PRICU|nr:PREDICTED: transcription factor IIIB 90 kDa subunit-like [Priapulus caudatus]XP_014673498.1 PREDICTED: transcription factor IIIB 90 kDa subunit-like [Priapulus caudatus]XP_014673505.1 PREDICTED: transcription factor IIIB 90 kDa subunit-like [Priapulus caudatus]XP_014673511.1 PREDICTED: transcription factor IIIB 90 kDa subunit-like [Priapulus caudatus]XP_014673519.1 PREDICTED: transcription factor IIIB 90 kDa subunit-like [Priapulus caudatus]